MDPSFHPDSTTVEDESLDEESQTVEEELMETSNQQQSPNENSTEVVNIILAEILNQVWINVKPRRRRRKLDMRNWSRNVAKQRRSEGASYITTNKLRPAKLPKPIDCSRCKFKCNEHLSEDERNYICRYYWNMDYKSKKNFILSYVAVQSPKRVLATRNQRAQRTYTKKCFFSKGNDKVQVCQKFFCYTLCISPAVIIHAVKHRSNAHVFDNIDHRGKHVPSNKTSDEKLDQIRAHIESFPCMESHYVRKQTKRKYLDQKLNIRKMYNFYKEQCSENNIEPASEITYRRVFGNEYNLSFFMPKHDQCLTCTNYQKADLIKKQELQLNYDEHIARKEACNKEKDKDKKRANEDPHFCSVTFDLQAVLQIPTCEVSLLYYSRKLSVFNLCIYESAHPNNGYCFYWSEINGKKGSCEIGSILYHYLSNCLPQHTTEVSLFSDTCGGQNRNQFVAILLLWAVQKIDNLRVIEQKFLESGHTYMEADSMHSSIECAKKHNSIYSMLDWSRIFKSARRKRSCVVNGNKITIEPYHIKEFKFNEFLDLKKFSERFFKNRTTDTDGEPVQWLKIKRMRYVKGNINTIFFNYDLSENFKSINISDTKERSTTYSTRRSKKKYPRAPTATTVSKRIVTVISRSSTYKYVKKTRFAELVQERCNPRRASWLVSSTFNRK